MFLYYGFAGLIADLALFLNLLFIMAAMAAFGATLTFPGIAGILLTVGMAVDANVIIFERIKEELRAGKAIEASIESGFNKAWSAIFDANLTTAITSFVLWEFGTGAIKGFAITLYPVAALSRRPVRGARGGADLRFRGGAVIRARRRNAAGA